MTDAAVSVGIPAYHNESTIEDTIRSLRRQTFGDWECFVSCDADSIATFEMAIAAVGDDARFTVTVNEFRLGACGNWNFVLAHATAPLFKLLCADDVLLPDALEAQVLAMTHHPLAVLCTGKRDIIDSKGRIIQRGRGLKHRMSPINRTEAIRLILRSGTNPFGEPSFALYRTEALRQAGGYSSDWEYAIDLASYVSVLEYGQLVALDQTIGSFRVSSSSWSASLVSQQGRELRRFLEYALPSSSSDIRSADLLIGKMQTALKSVLRRLVARIVTLRDRHG